MTKTNHLAWHHFSLDIPEEWEVIRFSKKPEDGQLVLSDRYGETMQIFWKRVKDVPDVGRRLCELAATNLDGEEDGSTRRRVSSNHGWKVYCHHNKSFPVFAGKYLSESKILLNITLPPHRKHDPRQLIDAILASYQPNDGEERRWAMGGIDVTLPADYLLEGVELLPARQRMSFETRKEFRTVVYRYGMMSRHLASQTLESFMAKVTDRKGSLMLRSRFEKDDNYPGVELKYYTKGTGSVMMNLLARKWVGTIYAWQSDDHERIYAIENHCRRDRGIENLEHRLQTV